MVIKDKSDVIKHGGVRVSKQEVIVIPSGSHSASFRILSEVPDTGEPEPGDVIDLGAPRIIPKRDTRVPAARAPNPRLYPGVRRPVPPPQPQLAVQQPRQQRGRTRRVFRRPVPNSRLYRAPAPRVQPPPARPRAVWPPPAPAHLLPTASRALLALEAGGKGVTGEAGPLPLHKTPCVSAPTSARVPRLVVEVPRTEMEGARGACGGEPHDTATAPSEFLAEFLSAIMRRQYAEALKYCRLILQYEPDNATARGFYPLLRHRLSAAAAATAPAATAAADSPSSSLTSSASPSPPITEPSAGTPHENSRNLTPSPLSFEVEQDGKGSAAAEGITLSSGSGGSSSLALDSSLEEERSRGGWSGSGAGGDSSAARSPFDLDSDNNGNPTALSSDDRDDDDDEDENDNALPSYSCGRTRTRTAVDTVLPTTPPTPAPPPSGSMSALQRLRERFTCSIK